MQVQSTSTRIEIEIDTGTVQYRHRYSTCTYRYSTGTVQYRYSTSTHLRSRAKGLLGTRGTVPRKYLQIEVPPYCMHMCAVQVQLQTGTYSGLGQTFFVETFTLLLLSCPVIFFDFLIFDF